jgi:hypothetical protein
LVVGSPYFLSTEVFQHKPLPTAADPGSTVRADL